MRRFSTKKKLLTVLLAAAVCTITATLVCRHYIVRGSPDELLSRADALAWNNEWIRATPLYAEAEKDFLRRGLFSKALYAHVSQLVVRAESDPIPPLLLELQKDLRLPQAQDPETYLRVLVILGMLESNYDAALARGTWKRVEEIAESRGHYLLMARAMGEQGLAAFLLGDVASAKKLVLRAWIAAKYLHDDAAHVRYASMYGGGLVELQRYDEAIRALDEAIDTAARSKGVAYPSIAINFKIDALRGLGRYSEALELANSAIARLPSAQLDAHLYQIMSSKGEVYGDAGRWNEAIEQYAYALGYARHLKYWRGIVQTGALLARAYERQNRLRDALASIDEAIHANEMIPDELYFSPRNLAIKAKLVEELGHRQESYQLRDRSLRLFDALLATAPTRNVERELLDQMRDVYSGYFESLAHDNRIEDAFDTIERARGRIEAQALAQGEFPGVHEPTPDEKKMIETDVALLEGGGAGTVAKLDRAITESNQLVGDAIATGEGLRRPFSLSSLEAHLGPEEVLLEYVLDDPSSTVLAITADGVRTYNLPSGSEIGSLAATYRKEINTRKTDSALARKLFAALLAPIPEYRQKSKVIIVPDGQLHLLPFSALMEGEGYTIQTHTFSVSPSASVLALIRDRVGHDQQSSFGYLGVAASIEPPAGSSWKPQWISVGIRRSLDPLPQSAQEVETIAADFPAAARVLLGREATISNFEAQALDKYKIVHLALHGYADLANPDRSALVFAPDMDRKDNGILDLRAIEHLHLRASLVTLSACDTGVGPVSEADVDNLANAFLEAGSASVVAALWDLEDQTTALLMTTFYKNLQMHESKGEALRNAKLEILKGGLPPFYWASVEIVGDASQTI